MCTYGYNTYHIYVRDVIKARYNLIHYTLCSNKFTQPFTRIRQKLHIPIQKLPIKMTC